MKDVKGFVILRHVSISQYHIYQATQTEESAYRKEQIC